MSFHLIHVLTPGARLGRERGRLVCKFLDSTSKSLPIEDVRGVIVAARGVSFSSDCLAALLEVDAFVLHCDSRFQPVGMTSPLPRMSQSGVALSQVTASERLKREIWKNLLYGKLVGHAVVLAQAGVPGNPLGSYLNRREPDEGSAARIYWRHLFKVLKSENFKRSERQLGPINQALNYGYAVLFALVHRSVVCSGLIPMFGVHHASRYRSTPLVFDLMEPLRSYVDKFLLEYFLTQQAIGGTMEGWPRAVASGLKGLRIPTKSGSLTLLDSIDFYTISVARAFQQCSAKVLWIPQINSSAEASGGSGEA